MERRLNNINEEWKQEKIIINKAQTFLLNIGIPKFGIIVTIFHLHTYQKKKKNSMVQSWKKSEKIFPRNIYLQLYNLKKNYFGKGEKSFSKALENQHLKKL